MGIEWSLRINNKVPDEILPFIQKCLLEEGIENIDVDSNGISISSSTDGWSDMEFILQNDYIYCLSNLGMTNGQRIMARIRQTLEESGFDLTLEEL
jgi:hypothetical protein